MAESHTHKIVLTRYGIAEVMKWCVKLNHKNVPGTDAPAFKRMQAELDAIPKAADYFMLGLFWKEPVTIEFTDEEIHTVDRCLYDNPNAESTQDPAMPYRLWFECYAAGAGKEKK